VHLPIVVPIAVPRRQASTQASKLPTTKNKQDQQTKAKKNKQTPKDIEMGNESYGKRMFPNKSCMVHRGLIINTASWPRLNNDSSQGLARTKDPINFQHSLFFHG
jgi:hypothetical protein